MECQGSFGALPNATNNSLVKLVQMQQAVARTYKGRFQIGQFDSNTTAKPYSNITNATIFSEEHQQLSKEGSEQSMVLLQNPGKVSGLQV
jgi:beta-glucosidase